MSDESTSNEIEERSEIQLTVPLDPAHSRMDVALREEFSEQPGVTVEQLVAEQVTPEVEQTLYQILQQYKYNE